MRDWIISIYVNFDLKISLTVGGSKSTLKPSSVMKHSMEECTPCLN